MDLSPLTERQRRFVQAVLDAGSVSGAAARLHCPPSDVREVLAYAERKLDQRVPRARETALPRITTEGNGWGEMRRRVAELDAQGLSQKEIAARIGRSVQTVNSHLHNIRRSENRDRAHGVKANARLRALETAGRCRCGLLLPCYHAPAQYPSSGTSNLGEASRG